MTLTVPSLQPGANSLPGELRVRNRSGNFARRRLMAGQRSDSVGLGTLICENPDDQSTCFDDGTSAPIDVPAPTYTTPLDLSTLAIDPASQAALLAITPNASIYSGPTTLAPSSPTPAAPSGYQWATLLNQSGQTIAKVLAISQGGSAVTLPNGQSLIYGSPTASAYGQVPGVATALTSSFGTGTMLLLFAGVALLLVMGKK